MNILYTCDNNYIWIMGISMISLFENNKEIINLNVYLLGNHITGESKKILYFISDKYDRNCFIIDTPTIDIPDILLSGRWPISAFTRLYSGQLLPNNLKQILYIDCDTIIEKSIFELENVDMKNYGFCGVKDCIGKTYKENIGLDSDSLYINAGVLLINLEKLREINVSDCIEKYLDKYASYVNYADQDILNGVFSNIIGILPPQYNIMTLISVYSKYDDIISLRHPTNYYTKEEIDAAIKEPRIIHYTTCMLQIRPWFVNSNHPFAKEFRKYMDISPWSQKSLMFFRFKSKEAKVIGIIQKLPIRISNKVLGLIHSELKPLYIRIKTRFNYT